MLWLRPLVALLVAATLSAQQDTPNEVFTKIGTVDHPGLREVSGLARSKTHPDTIWTHNDSGGGAVLFAINTQGQTIIPKWMQGQFSATPMAPKQQLWPGLRIELAANVDWEDVAVDGDKLYIADTGNNGNARRDLSVYVLHEPNPSAVQIATAFERFVVRYPDQREYPPQMGKDWNAGSPGWDFDCEALFVADGKLHFITKHRQIGSEPTYVAGTKLYRLDDPQPNKLNELTYLGSHIALFAPTGADVSPDGQVLAVSTMNAVWFFQRPTTGDNWFEGTALCLRYPFEPQAATNGGSSTLPQPPYETKLGKVEGITWLDDATLLLANEPGELYRVDTRGLGLRNTGK